MHRQTHMLTHTYLYVYNFSPKKAYQITQVPKENLERKHPTLLSQNQNGGRQDDDQISKLQNARLKQLKTTSKWSLETKETNFKSWVKVCKKIKKFTEVSREEDDE